MQLSNMPHPRKLLQRTSRRCGGVLYLRRRKGHVPPAAMQPHWRIGRRWATRPHPPVCFSTDATHTQTSLVSTCLQQLRRSCQQAAARYDALLKEGCCTLLAPQPLQLHCASDTHLSMSSGAACCTSESTVATPSCRHSPWPAPQPRQRAKSLPAEDGAGQQGGGSARMEGALLWMEAVSGIRSGRFKLSQRCKHWQLNPARAAWLSRAIKRPPSDIIALIISHQACPTTGS